MSTRRAAARRKKGAAKGSTSSSPAASGKASPAASAHATAIAMHPNGVGGGLHDHPACAHHDTRVPAAPVFAEPLEHSIPVLAAPDFPDPVHADYGLGAPAFAVLPALAVPVRAEPAFAAPPALEDGPLLGAAPAAADIMPLGNPPVHVHDAFVPFGDAAVQAAVDRNAEIVVLAPMNLPPDHDGLRRGVFFSAGLHAFVDAVSLFLYLLKYPAILFAAMFVILTLTGRVVDMTTESLTPICTVFPNYPVCRVTAAAGALTSTFGNLGRKPAHDLQHIDFPGLMAVQSHTLDELLIHSDAGSQLALSVKHAELAVKDLAIVVRASNLTSKATLAHALDEFAQDAKIVGRELQQLSAKLYGAVDTVLAFDDYALRAIAGAQSTGGDVKHTAAQVFKSTMSVLSSEVARVMLEATAVASMLDALEEKLAVIRTVCEQERIIAEAAMGEVLSELWTLVGGNKVKLLQLGQHLDILRNIDWYRGLSVAHVVATMETLMRVEAELGELRSKLSMPALADDGIPIEVHIASIEHSARRLNKDKLRARGGTAYTNYGREGGDRGGQQALIDAL